MGDVVNLGRVRKAVARMEKQGKAAVNSVKFGRTKAEKLTEETTAKRAAEHLDGHQLGDE